MVAGARPASRRCFCDFSAFSALNCSSAILANETSSDFAIALLKPYKVLTSAASPSTPINSDLTDKSCASTYVNGAYTSLI